MARKRKLDTDQLFKLAAIDCSYEEMADILGVSVSCLTQKHYCEVIKAGRAQGVTSLKRKQFDVAMSGNSRMLVWLGKQRLGQMDKSHVKVENISDQELAVIVEERLKKADAPKSS